MSLDDYYKKRNFQDTPEPKGRLTLTDNQRFVIQRHQATRLHYDLRLEMDGVLKSWAIPKGPSMNPKDKRLAIQTEDHPIQYLTFQGTIPKGNYGAGIMEIWDSGTYEIINNSAASDLAILAKGDIKIRFFGNKIKGDFALVRTSTNKAQSQWLLIKKSDTYAIQMEYDANSITLPTTTKSKKQAIDPSQYLAPMLAQSKKQAFNNPEWIYELKWDGYRVMAHKTGNQVQLFSRNGISYNSKFNEITSELQTLDHDFIIDGEVVFLNDKGLPNFQALQNYPSASLDGSICYIAFDMIFLNGISMVNVTLKNRKQLLQEVISDLQFVRYCDHIEAMGLTFYDRAKEMGMEGIMAKDGNSKYSPGYRTDKWLKIKEVISDEFIICGYTKSENARSFGSLILGEFQDGKLVYVGNCGSGFSDKKQKDLIKKFNPLEVDQSPFVGSINLKGRESVWILPHLICEIKYSERTENGILRHPVFKTIREDKYSPSVNISAEKRVFNTSSKDHLEVDGIQVPITNLDKIYWPDSGLKKYDLLDYYIKISETILPYLINRPESLHRHPNGINQDSFYQKDNEYLPDWVTSAAVHSKSNDKTIDYLVCQNEATLLYMANLGCIELNPWHSQLGSLENPDYCVIDLDPSEKNTFDEVIEAALKLKEVLDRAKIDGFCKTSGSTGLHIYIPLGGMYSYEESRHFAQLLCYFVHEELPTLTSMERSVHKRKGKIYLDFMQNRKGQTLASAYCVRPKPGAPVSAPLLWNELVKGISITDFNIGNMSERLDNIQDPFLGIFGKGIDMEKAIQELENIK